MRTLLTLEMIDRSTRDLLVQVWKENEVPTKVLCSNGDQYKVFFDIRPKALRFIDKFIKRVFETYPSNLNYLNFRFFEK